MSCLNKSFGGHVDMKTNCLQIADLPNGLVFKNFSLEDVNNMTSEMKKNFCLVLRLCYDYSNNCIM